MHIPILPCTVCSQYRLGILCLQVVRSLALVEACYLGSSLRREELRVASDALCLLLLLVLQVLLRYHG